MRAAARTYFLRAGSTRPVAHCVPAGQSAVSKPRNRRESTRTSNRAGAARPHDVAGDAYRRHMTSHLTRCGYCGQYVDRVTHQDAHDPKDCRKPAGCGRTNLPVGYFPLKPSSGDGRRHICVHCVAENSQTKSEQRTQQRAHGRRDELVLQRATAQAPVRVEAVQPLRDPQPRMGSLRPRGAAGQRRRSEASHGRCGVGRAPRVRSRFVKDLGR